MSTYPCFFLIRIVILGLSLLAYSNGIWAQVEKVDSLKKLLQDDISDFKRMKTLGDLARMMEYQDPAQGLNYAFQMKEMAENQSDTAHLIKALSYLGGCTNRHGNIDEAEEYWREALNLARISADSLQIGILLGDLGNLYSTRGLLDSAVYYYHLALDFYGDYNVYRAISYNNLGIEFEKQGNYAKATEYYLSALSAFENAKHSLGIAAVYDNLTNVYYLQQLFQEAITYSYQSITLKKKTDNKHGISISYNNLGNLYQAQNQLDSAIFFHEQSLKLKQELGEKPGICISFINLGKLYAEKQEIPLALNYLKQAYAQAEKLDQSALLGRSAIFLGKLMATSGSETQGESLLLEGLKIAEEIEESEDQLMGYKALSHLYRIKKDDRAFDFLEKFITLNDSLRNDEQSRAITRLELKYEFDKEKEMLAIEQTKKEALLTAQIERQTLLRNVVLGGLMMGCVILALVWRSYLQKKSINRKLESQKNTIQQALEDRETLLKEIHHRVKNNLQVVSSLLSLQSRTIKDPTALDAIEEGRNRVKAMALIHQNLYQEENLVGVQLPQYIEKLTNNLINSYKVDTRQIKIICEVSPISLDVDTLIPLGLIINELFTNALKYAFLDRSEGEIKVRINQSRQGLLIEVRDNGVGLPADFNIQKSTSLGFKLIRSFVKKMKAEMEITNGDGTQVSIVLPPRN